MSIAEKTRDKRYCVPSQPFLQEQKREEVLHALLCPGDICTPTYSRQLQRLAREFEHYLAYYPYGAWRQGLLVTTEMHRWTEQYLPLAELWRVWRAVLVAGIRYPSPVMADEFLGAASWLMVLERCRLSLPVAPHLLMRRMLLDEVFRRQVLFAWYVPQQHGGGFGRYPQQLAWLREWLTMQRRETVTSINCLDAACGSGEGSYELAATVLGAGYDPQEMTVCGSTLQPLAVAAAALVYFPHDLARQEAYQRRVATMVPVAALKRISFRQENLLQAPQESSVYSVILCNGLLGGPLLHEPGKVLQVLKYLVKQLKRGGILLADDRFHAGWRCTFPLTALRELLVSAGLQLVAVPSGVGGIRSSGD